MGLPRISRAGKERIIRCLNTRLIFWAVAAAFALAPAAMSAACGGDAAPDDAPPPASTTPAPAAGYYALDRVLEVSIRIAPEDWDTLRNQSRTLEDVFAEIGEKRLSEPFADIYTWFSADVTVDGETHSDAGVRKKGFVGPQSDVKPSLKIRFDKYADGQALGGVLERMTLNNGLQDDSLIRTCMSFAAFAAADYPAPRCNFASVSVNGENLGVYANVEDIEHTMLAREFADADGNLYEGTVSDFHPTYRGTFEKKTNSGADDWSDIDALTAAVQDPSAAGWEALKDAVDLDRFLTFWALEVLIAHWDGYAGNRNNYWFYREPGGAFVFIPWGVDQVFSDEEEDPNPFDDVTEPPPSVLANGAIANRLYNDPKWRAAYAARLSGLLDEVWDEDALIGLADEMAAIVRRHALPKNRAAAKNGAEGVREFIRGRRAVILADLRPEPPEWPDGGGGAAAWGELASGEIELRFSAVWGSSESANPFDEGEVARFAFGGAEIPADGIGAIAGAAGEDEREAFGIENGASLTVMGFAEGGAIQGLTLTFPLSRLAAGETLAFGKDEIGGGVWRIPPGAAEPSEFLPVTSGALTLLDASAETGAAISAEFAGAVGYGAAAASSPSSATAPGAEVGASDFGIAINEVAAKGDPLDWFELYNYSDSPIALGDFVFSDDLDNAAKRVPFPPDMEIAAGGYSVIELDKDAWSGFALGSDEELGVWTADGAPVDSVDWEEGDSDAGASYARVPDGTGAFTTVSEPTPGAGNGG